ncbi:hypothetical protein [Verrucomicrobium sp. BvORR106]|uniref:hypothetical protein n=1 Tax=Verrucomicrobium sp. BvORR106 TaxID=1403819 RepID=UPI00056E7D09|nr:hypothetical protein [Verrucomicrobium sp. BvORR106]
MFLVLRYYLCTVMGAATVMLAVLAPQSYGTTVVTPEQSAAMAIASLVESYSRSHDGTPPRSWEDLQPMLTVPVHEWMPYAAPAKRYAFVSSPLRLAAPLRGELIAIHRSDIFDTTLEMTLVGFYTGLKGPGRNVIYRNEEGRYLKDWVTSSYVQDLFSRAGVALPEPDREPERIWVTRARRAGMCWKAVLVTAAGVLGWWLWRYFRRETSWGMMVGFWLDDLRKRKHG